MRSCRERTTASMGKDRGLADLFFPLRASRPLETEKEFQRHTSRSGEVFTVSRSVLDLLDELVEEPSGAEDHPGCLRLLGLRAGHRQCVIHVTFFMKYGLRVNTRQMN